MSEIMALAGSKILVELNEVTDTKAMLEDSEIKAVSLPGKLKKYKYVPWGEENTRPYQLMELIAADEVMSQNKLFNVLTCYGSGLKYKSLTTKEPTTDPEIKKFLLQNAMNSYYIEQCTDMKYFFFTVSIIILSRDGKRIVDIRHKDACNCRFQVAKEGRIGHVFYANWLKPITEDNVQIIPLLDERNPWGDLEVRTGKMPNNLGEKKDEKVRKYAIVSKFPMPGNPYYPSPYYTAIFRGDWYTIKQLIARSKKAKLRNISGIKYQVEIHKDYWDILCDQENITDPKLRQARVQKEKENIRDFISGIDNSGKMWITGCYTHPSSGELVSMVKITNIDSKKEGGDWSEDIQEAVNMFLYADGVHANLVGSVPGKTQVNNSGSDKRELFTLKQALEAAYHDVLAIPHWAIIGFNGWIDKVEPEVPMIMLTTLDTHTDAKEVSIEQDLSQANK